MRSRFPSDEADRPTRMAARSRGKVGTDLGASRSVGSSHRKARPVPPRGHACGGLGRLGSRTRVWRPGPPGRVGWRLPRPCPHPAQSLLMLIEEWKCFPLPARGEGLDLAQASPAGPQGHEPRTGCPKPHGLRTGPCSCRSPRPVTHTAQSGFLPQRQAHCVPSWGEAPRRQPLQLEKAPESLPHTAVCTPCRHLLAEPAQGASRRHSDLTSVSWTQTPVLPSAQQPA